MRIKGLDGACFPVRIQSGLSMWFRIFINLPMGLSDWWEQENIQKRVCEYPLFSLNNYGGYEGHAHQASQGYSRTNVVRELLCFLPSLKGGL
jgi:hypothetical protein